MPPQALVSTNHDRAAPKGLGAVKAAGNYAADLSPVHGAHAQGYNTTLYLDAKERKYVEEFSVCNFVGITKDETCDIMRLLHLDLDSSVFAGKQLERLKTVIAMEISAST